MGINTVLVGDELNVRWTPMPTCQRPPFVPNGGPAIAPVAPATDVREGATVALYPQSFAIPVVSYEFTLELYLDGEEPGDDTPTATLDFTQVYGDAAPTYIIPVGTADKQFSLLCRAIDRGGRASGWLRSGVTDIGGGTVIIAEFAPEFTVAPAVTGADSYVGTTLTCDGGTVTGTPTPDITYQWRRDGVAITSATASTYVLVTADSLHGVTCLVTATNSVGAASAASNVTNVTTPISWPASVARADFMVIETSATTGVVGTRQMQVGTFAGGTAVTIPAGFTCRRWFSATKGGADNISSASPTVLSSEAINFTGTFPPGTVRYHGLVWWHTATDAWQHATDQADLVTIGGVDYPYGTVVIAGGAVISPIGSLGTPTHASFYTDAIAAPAIKSTNKTTPPTEMGNAYSCGSAIALGIGVLKAHAGSITQAKSTLDISLTVANAPLNCAGAGDWCCNPLSTMFTCMKYAPGFWTGQLTADQRAKITASMKVHLFSGAFVCADANSLGEGTTIRGYGQSNGTPGAYSQKDTAPNQSIQGPCSLMIALGFFGSVSAAKAVLSMTPADLRAEIVAAGLDGSPLHDTMDWRNAGYTGPPALGSWWSSKGPTDDQIVSTVNSGDMKWFKHTLNEYHRILAMMTWARDNPDQRNTPWLANGIFGDVNYKAGNSAATVDKDILIGPGWGVDGLSSTGTPVTSGGVQGRIDTDRDPTPGTGLQGMPAELAAWQDDKGKRSAMHYTVHAMRSLIGAWLSLWISGLLDKNNADILAVLQIMDRGVKASEYCHDGYNSWAHGHSDGHWPLSSQDWQRNNIYDAWIEVLAPALGL